MRNNLSRDYLFIYLFISYWIFPFFKRLLTNGMSSALHDFALLREAEGHLDCDFLICFVVVSCAADYC